jgi:hypothetical protein
MMDTKTWNDTCKNCGKAKGHHKAIGLNCPVGERSRVGYILFHNINFFYPKKKDRKRGMNR